MFDDPGMGTVDESIHVAVVPSGVQIHGHVQRGGNRIEGPEREFVEPTVFGTGYDGLTHASHSGHVSLTLPAMESHRRKNTAYPTPVHDGILASNPHRRLNW